MIESEPQMLMEVSLIYTHISLLLAAVDRGSRAVNNNERISHVANTLKYSHIRRRAAILELHAVAEASAARNIRGDDDALLLGCRQVKLTSEDGTRRSRNSRP